MMLNISKEVITPALIASSVTYCVASRANGVATTAVRTGTGLIAATCGIATNLIAGPMFGGIVETSISFIGKDIITPVVSTGIDAGAILTAATAGVIGGTVGAAVCAIHRGTNLLF